MGRPPSPYQSFRCFFVKSCIDVVYLLYIYIIHMYILVDIYIHAHMQISYGKKFYSTSRGSPARVRSVAFPSCRFGDDSYAQVLRACRLKQRDACQPFCKQRL